MEHPTSNKEIRIFNEIVNFIKNYIPLRAYMIDPLTQLTRENYMFTWKNKQQEAFKNNKQLQGCDKRGARD